MTHAVEQLISQASSLSAPERAELAHFLLTSIEPAEEKVSRFHVLAEQWRRETMHHSSIAKKALHPAYQEIIGMGKGVIPLLLAELRREPDDWFWALHALTGADPVPETSRGKIQEMVEAWLKWGSEQGYKL